MSKISLCFFFLYRVGFTRFITNFLKNCIFKNQREKICTMIMWVLSYYQFDPDEKKSLYLCVSLSCRFHKVVDSTELCACVNGASLNMDFSVIMTSPSITTHNYYDSRNMVSPYPGHHDCTVLYALYNLKCKRYQGMISLSFLY